MYINHAEVAKLADLPASALAEMAELVDAHASGACGETLGSSTLPLGRGQWQAGAHGSGPCLLTEM